MIIDGKSIAEDILVEVRDEANKLKDKNITPHLVIVTIGEESVWETYVRQKLKRGEELGIKTTQLHIENASQQKVLDEVKKLNTDPTVHGIIIQRPLPKEFDLNAINQAVIPEKDIDGFCDNTIYKAPVWLGVRQIISHFLGLTTDLEFKKSLLNQSILVIGKGQTGGAPIIKGLRELGIEPFIIDSKTKNKDELIRKADIIISAVGSGVVDASQIKEDALLVGVGIHKEDGKLKGDYSNEEAQKNELSFTPTPGGVGPLTIAFLFKNTIDAAKKQTA